MATDTATSDPSAIAAAPIDTVIDIITPENIAFRYRAAGPFRRLPAYLVDCFVRVLIVLCPILLILVAILLLGIMGVNTSGTESALRRVFSWGVGLWLIVWFIVDWFYGGLFETFWNGQTPGKRMMRLRVLTVEGLPINGLQAVLRNILRAVDALPMFFLFPLYQLGLIASAVLDQYQRLGDWAAGTVVVVEEREWSLGVERVTEPGAMHLAAQLPANFRPNRTLGRALAQYVARRMTFGWQRRVEIALHLAEPLRQKFNLPRGTNPDLLLCALYHRTFIAERADDLVAELAEERAGG